MEAHEQLLALDFDKYASKVVDAYYTLKDIYFALEQLGYEEEDEAAGKEIKLLTRIMDIYKMQAEKDSKYLEDIAWTYDAIGEVYEGIENDKKAEEMYDMADKIRESING